MVAGLVFPQDQTAWVYTRPGDPIKQPGTLPLAIFEDEDCTTPAAIKTYPGALTIPGHTVSIGLDGLIPFFLGPDAVDEDSRLTRLWALPPLADNAYPLEASFGLRFDDINREAQARQQPFVSFGPVFTKFGSVPFYPCFDGHITKVVVALSDQTSGTTKVDVNVGVGNATPNTIFTNQAHRPTLSGVGRQFVIVTLIDAPNFTEDSFITCDIDEVGVNTTDLIVTPWYEPA